ncbi:MAG: tight adherence protein [Actinomycetota bacterium]|nr:tight adherence protein [Actinomycetota bacterium]
MTMPFVCAVLVALAVLAAPAGSRGRPVGPRRLRFLARGRVRASGRDRSATVTISPAPASALAFVPRGFRRRSVPPGRPVAGPEVAVLADQIAALARAGLPPERIWSALAEYGSSPSVRDLARTVVAGRHRSQPTTAVLRFLPGGPAALFHLALALDVSERTGAGLAQVLGRLAQALRAEERAAEEIRGALAGPQATALVLAVLPLGGLALGTLLGGRPWYLLLATAPGRLCLVAGCLFWGTGQLWARHLVRRAKSA